ncbi:hypothetical protein HMPREF3069_25580 [Achromobacter xylosoxidans]|uniref:DUF1120 domain-containing protein n=1 Tax=Alcaligenes xylosoxydans xylosoxydans TaxID=85698 RepID=UPI0006C3A041|nr:DUF1120 domain-containing protein [Achromobacter xylosoxidans]OFL39384.1 hypothetical protein HMPREF2772_24095 [Achromobacter xylosoxidans]OFS36041.1 hypothetical protein HMPREF3069_25580 [Achromobacter xylosoxidans]CUJ34186.1 Protein of uncharacterised function (DUF1120) [Achromobacter xylosoxidans]
MRTNQKLATLSLALAASMASFGAQAQSIDVRVIGTITPAACLPAIAGGAVVDYGNIPASTLNMTTTNRLPERTVAFSITCDAPTRAAIRAIDGRESSRVPGIVTAIGAAYNDTYNFGLGTVSNANVGGYVLRLRQQSFTADSVSVFNTGSTDGGATWAATGTGGMHHSEGFIMSWSATNGGAPIAFTNLTGNLSVEAVLNRGDALPLKEQVPLDGLATLEIVYL